MCGEERLLGGGRELGEVVDGAAVVADRTRVQGRNGPRIEGHDGLGPELVDVGVDREGSVGRRRERELQLAPSDDAQRIQSREVELKVGQLLLLRQCGATGLHRGELAVVGGREAVGVGIHSGDERMRQRGIRNIVHY